MTDQELRSDLLANLYTHRAQDWVQIGIGASACPEEKEKIRIAEQLAQYGLIEFKMLNRHLGGMARIKAAGVDVMEGTAKSPLAITIDQSQTINVSGSSNFQIGDGNTQTINDGIAVLVQEIEKSGGSAEEKAEAKSLLRRVLEHPLVAAIAGGAVGLIK